MDMEVATFITPKYVMEDGPLLQILELQLTLVDGNLNLQLQLMERRYTLRAIEKEEKEEKIYG